jgi:hypothetical protein
MKALRTADIAMLKAVNVLTASREFDIALIRDALAAALLFARLAKDVEELEVIAPSFVTSGQTVSPQPAELTDGSVCANSLRHAAHRDRNNPVHTLGNSRRDQ